MELGFAQTDVESALAAGGGDVQRAAATLMDAGAATPSPEANRAGGFDSEKSSVPVQASRSVDDGIPIICASES